MSITSRAQGFSASTEPEEDGDEDAAPPGPETDRCPGCGWASGHSAKCPYR